MRRFRGARGRTALGWGLLFFLVGQLGLSLALETNMPQLRSRTYGHKRTWLKELRERAPERPLILMLGSSRTLGGFQARRLDGMPGPDGKPLAAFNFGLVLTGPIKLTLHWNTLRAQGIKPRLLLVEVLPPFLNSPGDGRKGEEDWIQVQELSLHEACQLARYCQRAHELNWKWLWSRVLPAYHHRIQILEDWLSSWQAPPFRPQPLKLIDRWGWSAAAGRRVVTPGNSWLWTSNAYLHFGSPMKDFQLDPGATRALRDLLENCQHDHIPVALVLMPEGSQFRSWYPRKALRQLDELLAQLQQEYKVPVIDARAWVPDQGFWDSHHMLPSGAETFTTRLIPEVHQILVQSEEARKTEKRITKDTKGRKHEKQKKNREQDKEM